MLPFLVVGTISTVLSLALVFTIPDLDSVNNEANNGDVPNGEAGSRGVPNGSAANGEAEALLRQQLEQRPALR